jgi:hypothetical protein
MLHFSGLFCIVSGRGENHFPVSACSLRPKSLLVNTARPSMAQATGSIPKESVVSAWISNPDWRELGDSDRLFLYGPKKKSSIRSVRAFAQAPALLARGDVLNSPRSQERQRIRRRT